MVLGSLAKNIEVRERLDDFVAHTGLDPARQLRHVVVALPGDPKEERRVVIVADVDEVDTQRVTSWLQRPAGTRVSVVVRKRNQIILGVGGWAPFVAALTNSDTTLASAKDNLVLRRLCARAADGHFFWFAALIPPGVRSAMREDRRFGDAAALMRISGFLDVDATLRASVVAELSNAEDAGHLSRRLSAFLNETKRNPDLLLVGLSPYLDGLRVEARGSRLLASYEIPAAHQDEVFEHIENMLRRSGKTSPQQGQTK
jgi:hypothetical protein